MVSNQNVEEQLYKYKSSIEAFNNECELLVYEADSFQDRIMRTANAVKYSNISPWKHVSESGPIVKTYKHFSSESEADDLEYKVEIEEASDSVDTQHNYDLGGKNFKLSKPECPTLPNVPEDSPWDEVDHDELHENVVGRSGPELVDEILTRLTKLKSFSNAWVELVVTNTEKVEPVATEDTVAIASSESDRLEFDRWYYEKSTRAPPRTPMRTGLTCPPSPCPYQTTPVFVLHFCDCCGN